MKKLLGIFAHPDDESIASGGTIAKYAKAGWQVDLVTATRGESGGSGEVRAKELAEAAEHLGIRSVTFLDYKDGQLAGKVAGEIEDTIVRLLEDMKPDVILTHEPAGITHHPDHIKLSLAATFAFQKYAWTRHEANPDDDNPPKLYYACFPETIISYVVKHKYFPAELFGKPCMGVDDKRVTTVINIKKFSAAKQKALESHATQRSLLSKYLDIPRNPFMNQEYFILRMVGLVEVFMGKNDRISDRL